MAENLPSLCKAFGSTTSTATITCMYIHAYTCVYHSLTTESLWRVLVTYHEKSPEIGTSYPNCSPGLHPAAGSGTEAGPVPLG